MVWGLGRAAIPVSIRLPSSCTAARHWPLVQQAALEVHETNLEAVLQVLVGVGVGGWGGITAYQRFVEAGIYPDPVADLYCVSPPLHPRPQVLREEAGFSMVEVGQDTALAGSSLHSVFCRRRW